MSSAPSVRRLPLATGLSYQLLEWDAEGDHTVILLHGFLDNAWTFLPTIRAGLAGRAHLVAPDLRGFGDSDRVGAGGYYHYADYLADLDALIASVGRARVSLVGHSMGANVALYYAGTFPAKVFRLALLEPVAPPPQNEIAPERVAAWIDGWRRALARPPRSYASLEEAAARLRERDPRTSLELALELAEHGTRRGADGRFHFKHDPVHATTGPYGIRRETARAFWERVRCPTMRVEGADSEYASADGSTRPEIPGARREVVADAGHMLTRHQPAALARLLVDFLSLRAS